MKAPGRKAVVAAVAMAAVAVAAALAAAAVAVASGGGSISLGLCVLCGPRAVHTQRQQTSVGRKPIADDARSHVRGLRPGAHTHTLSVGCRALVDLSLRTSVVCWTNID